METTVQDDVFDCLVIGGGAAGLTAAVYLGRYRRRALVIDDGGSRIAKIPRTRNVLGFPDGIEGPRLLERMRVHAGRYGARLEIGHVERLDRHAVGFEAAAGSRVVHARKVLLATGARDVEPQVPGLAPALQAGVVRYCPICDGYETQGQRVAVLGKTGHGLRESLFVAGFDNEVTWLAMATQHAVAPEDVARLQAAGVRIENRRVTGLRCGPERVLVDVEGGEMLEFDTLYPALGLVHASGLATALGARSRGDGQLEVSEHYETTVAGLYAAGDVAMDLNQINVAAGQAAIAATAIHNAL
jgi:thioredoxin reductase (NADPH)